MIDVFALILVVSGFILAGAALAGTYAERQKAEEMPIRVLQALRDLGGRGSLMQIGVAMKRARNDVPLHDLQADLEALRCEGVLDAEWQEAPVTPGWVPRRLVYSINPRFAAEG